MKVWKIEDHSIGWQVSVWGLVAMVTKQIFYKNGHLLGKSHKKVITCSLYDFVGPIHTCINIFVKSDIKYITLSYRYPVVAMVTMEINKKLWF